MLRVILLGILLHSVPMNLLADSPSFDFFEIGYTVVNAEGVPKDFNGYDLRGSYSFDDASLASGFFIAGDSFKANLKANKERRQVVTLGVGYRYNLSNQSSLFAEIDGVIVNPTGNGNHENGYEFTTGVRSNFSHRLELKTAIQYLDTKTYSLTTYIAGAAVRVTDSFAIYSDVSLGTNSNRYSIGLRYSF